LGVLQENIVHLPRLLRLFGFFGLFFADDQRSIIKNIHEIQVIFNNILWNTAILFFHLNLIKFIFNLFEYDFDALRLQRNGLAIEDDLLDVFNLFLLCLLVGTFNANLQFALDLFLERCTRFHA